MTVSEGHGKDLSVSEIVPFLLVIQWSMKVLPLPDSSATGRLYIYSSLIFSVLNCTILQSNSNRVVKTLI